jgi:hypothetical protein
MKTKTLAADARCNACGRTITAGETVRYNRLGVSHPSILGCEAAAKAAAPVAVARGDQATERQVRYALDLQAAYWTPAVLGGARYSEAELHRMERDQISRVIDALVAERDLAGV